MEVSAQGKQHVVALAAHGSLTVLPGHLECGEILSQDTVSFVLFMYYYYYYYYKR